MAKFMEATCSIAFVKYMNKVYGLGCRGVATPLVNHRGHIGWDVG